jgi:TRAP-type mannitol/chloroaromatic compound transport system permease small subunit
MVLRARDTILLEDLLPICLIAIKYGPNVFMNCMLHARSEMHATCMLLALMYALTYSNTDSVLFILERIENKHGGNHGFFYIILWLRNFVLLIELVMWTGLSEMSSCSKWVSAGIGDFRAARPQ